MPQLPTDDIIVSHRYALCVGIGQYTELRNRNLRYAVKDAATIAERLRDSQRGNFAVTLLTEPAQTSKTALDETLDELLNAPDRKAEDLVLIYFSCHGDVVRPDDTFCLLPSNATLQNDATFKKTTVLGIYDLTKLLSGARVRNIIMLLDVCHSGGAGVALQHLKLDLPSGPNLFIIGAARQDQVAMQSSQLEHGIFTHCLLRAFEQPPTKDGWLTISQIYSFISDDIQWFTKERPIQIQGWSVSVNPNLALLRNPGYPELSPLPPIWNVLLQRNPFFTGQEDVLVQLATMLRREQKTALSHPQAITGLGGIGKTQLAIEYAYRYRQNYHAVLWVRADMHEELISSFVTIAHLLDLPQKDEPDLIIVVEAVKAWLANRSNWLLILDNADDLALVEEFIPPAFQGHLLLTTRAQVMGGLAHKIEVEVMRPETGALLLLRRAGLLAPNTPLEQASPADVTVAKELSEEMGGLPLALDQAGAYIEEVACNLQDYQRLYRTRRAELLKERGGIVPDHPESVAATWSLAFQKVEQGNPAASDLLCLCAFLHPDAIPEEIITKGAEYLGPQLQATASDSLALNKAITALRAYSLLHRDSATHTLTIHRLVQAVLKDRMDEATQQQWAERTVCAVNAAFPEGTFAHWQRCQQSLPHALAATKLIEDYGFSFPEATHLLAQVGSYLQERAQYEQAEPLMKQVLSMREQTCGYAHPDTATALDNLAILSYLQGKYEQAESLYLRALTIREQVLGSEHPDTAEILNNLAVLYEKQGRYAQAEPLYLRALTINEQGLGSEHPDTVAMFNNLALLYSFQGRYTQAEPLYQRTLTIQEHVLGPEHPAVSVTLNNLALLYQNQGRYAQAEPLYRRALTIRESALGPEHPETATTLHNLAYLYENQGQYTQAEPLYRRALTIKEQALGPEHPSTATTLDNLGILYRKQGRYQQAEPLHQRALTIRESALGPECPEMTYSLDNLGILYYKQGRYDLAKSCYQQALTIQEHVLGPEHPETALTFAHLAQLYQAQGKDAQAKALYQRALTIQEHVLGPEHPDLAETLAHLAHFYADQGQDMQAEPLYQRALAIQEHVLGSSHPTLAMTLTHLACLYGQRGQYEQAASLVQRAVTICEQMLDAEHPDTAVTLDTLASLSHLQGQYEQAELLYQRALAICEKQLGPEHPDTVATRKNYYTLVENMKRKGKGQP